VVHAWRRMGDMLLSCPSLTRAASRGFLQSLASIPTKIVDFAKLEDTTDLTCTSHNCLSRQPLLLAEPFFRTNISD
jgi:hypothetical protein